MASSTGKQLYGASTMKILLQNETLPCSSHFLDSLWLHTSEPSFQGSKSVVNIMNDNGSIVTKSSFLQAIDNGDDDDYEITCFQQAGKKRRLTREQVQFLESKFEVEKKLEPERKDQLAKELGLQPRQVAIWFQNRRARFKTKKLENDYGALKASFHTLKADYDNLLQENQKLKQQVNILKNRLIPIKKEKQNSDEKSSSDAINLEHKEDKDLILNASSENGSKVEIPVMVICKQEDANSTKSEVLDLESQSSLMEPADSTHALEPDQSDFSQDDESQNLLTLPFLHKVEDCSYDPENSCSFKFPIEDQMFCFWSY